jgi:hypothetical protein
VPDPDNIANSTANPGGFFATIQTAVASLGTGTPPVTAADIAQATLTASQFTGTAGPPSPFSDYLSQNDPPALPSVQVGQGQTEVTGLSASHNGLIPQPAPDNTNFTTTGSYMRDIMRALATIGSLRVRPETL